MTGGGLRMNSLGLSSPSFTESSTRTSPSTVVLIFPSGLLSSHACAESSLLGSCSDVSGSLLSPSLFGNRPQYIEHSVQFSCSVVSDSLRPHESQHSRPPCPSPSPEFTQTSVHRVGDAIQPSHPLSSRSPPTPNTSQHQSLFQWVNSSPEVDKVMEFQL